MKKVFWVASVLLILVIIGVYFFNISLRTGNGKAELSFGNNPVSLTDKNTVLIPADSGVNPQAFSNQSAKYQISLPLNWTKTFSTSSGDMIVLDAFEPSNVVQNPDKWIQVINFTYQAYTNTNGDKLPNKEIVEHELNAMKQGSFPTAQNVHIYESKTDSNMYVANFTFTKDKKEFNTILKFVFGDTSFYDVIAVVPSNISKEDFKPIQVSLDTFRTK